MGLMRGSRQVKVGLRVLDLDKSCALYKEVGFRLIPHDDQPNLRYLTFGLTWLILSDLHATGTTIPSANVPRGTGRLAAGSYSSFRRPTWTTPTRYGSGRTSQSPSNPRMPFGHGFSTAWIPADTR